MAKRILLEANEETSRLKSWVLWLQAKDENTKLFQRYVKGNKTINTI